MKIETVDCDYLLPRFAASYVIAESGHAIIVDTGTASSVPAILETLKREGIGPENVDYVIVTHVHLDHSGGASELMKRLPGAVLLAHPRAARHLIDPTRLVASAKSVYGEDAFQKLYGTIEPVPAERVRAIEDESELSWQRAALTFLHTRGHANHHICILLSEGGHPQAIFTGDSFGVCYPDLQREGRMILPTTSPTDFDAAEARASVRRVVATGAPVAYPTHFGPFRGIPEAASQLLEELDFSEALLNEAIRSPEPDERLETLCRERIARHLPEVFARRGRRWDEEAARILELDMNLNAQGLAYVAAQRRKKGEERKK